ncbi:hypothetical protein EDD16DRAFT_534131 [Pisolithus croceorrhizus]|nr:hypothetical protein EDD16DRAFT_534131 [Pisolithus croceorrhizus]
MPPKDTIESDSVIRDRSVILRCKDGHALWLSKKALELSAPLLRDIEGGVIFRGENGEPAGLLLGGAQSLVKEHGMTEHDLLRRFTATMGDALSLGLTSIHNAGFRPVSLAFFERLESLSSNVLEKGTHCSQTICQMLASCMRC